MAGEIFTSLVLSLLNAHPQIHIDIVTEGRLVDIVAGGFDLGVRRTDLVPADMIAIHWASHGAVSSWARRPI